MRRGLDLLYNASLALAGVFLVGIFLVMIGEAVMRSSGHYLAGAPELVGWFSAAAAFLALPATFIRGDMVRVGLAVDRLPAATRKAVLIGGLALAIAFALYMLWAVAAYLWSSYRFGEMTQGMIYIPAWIPQLGFLTGALLLLIAMVDSLLTLLTQAASDSWANPTATLSTSPPSTTDKAIPAAHQTQHQTDPDDADPRVNP